MATICTEFRRGYWRFDGEGQVQPEGRMDWVIVSTFPDPVYEHVRRLLGIDPWL